MVRPQRQDKKLIVDILAASFATNKSVAYIVKQDSNRDRRLRSLMEYAFEICFAFGEVFLSEDKKGCALVLFPEKKRITINSILWDVRLVVNCIGIRNIARTLTREKQIKSQHPKEGMVYLWFIGVDPTVQHRGLGSRLLREVIEESVLLKRPIYLETSAESNVSWYQHFGLRLFHQMNFGYTLYFLTRPPFAESSVVT